MLSVAAGTNNLITLTYDEKKLVWHKLLGLEPAFRQLVLLNAEGEELYRNSRLSKLALSKSFEHQKKETFNETKSEKTHISSIYIDEKTYEPMVIMAVSIRDFFGDLRGILMAEVNLKFMWDLVGSMQIGKKGQAYVVDRSGNLIAAIIDVSRVLKREL